MSTNAYSRRRATGSRAALLLLLALGVTCESPADEEPALFSVQVLTPEVALDFARAGLHDCRKRGYQVAVAVVDRFGGLQVLLRDRLAGPHTPDTARRKAWTAVSFRTDTLELESLTRSATLPAGVQHISGALMVGGGRRLEADGFIVGGLGVSGAPSGAADDECARAAIEAMVVRLM